MASINMKLNNLSKQAKAWIFYDGGNSAFATTVLAAFFPIFFKEYWSSGLTDLQATSYLGTVSYTHLTLPTILRV